MVSMAWAKPCSSTNPIRRLHIKLSRTAKALKAWNRLKIGNTKLQLAFAREIILRLDTAGEVRDLSDEEYELRKLLKSRCLGLSVVERAKARQRSRLRWLRHGDANTKFFHLRAAARQRKNYIQSLVTEQGTAFLREDKEKIIHDHFCASLGTTSPRGSALNWEALGYQPLDLSELEAPFSMEEIKDTIFSMPIDKASGPDGFTGLFFRSC